MIDIFDRYIDTTAGTSIPAVAVSSTAPVVIAPGSSLAFHWESW